jgi:hypothetical protein
MVLRCTIYPIAIAAKTMSIKINVITKISIATSVRTKPAAYLAIKTNHF